MATQCSLFFIDSKNYYILSTTSTERFRYINLDYEYSLWLESPLRLLLYIYTNQSVGKESKCVKPKVSVV